MTQVLELSRVKFWGHSTGKAQRLAKVLAKSEGTVKEQQNRETMNIDNGVRKDQMKQQEAVACFTKSSFLKSFRH